MDWTVMIEAAGDLAAEQIDPERVDALIDVLADYHAAATAAPRRYGAQFDLDAPTAEKATEAALSTFRAAAHKAELPNWPIIRVEVMTVDEQETALAEPTFPDVLGVTEAAQMLGVSRQRLDQLTSHRDFPAPMVRLAAGPVWLRSSIEGFERRWDRRPGRPPKAAPAAAAKQLALAAKQAAKSTQAAKRAAKAARTTTGRAAAAARGRQARTKAK